MPTTTPMRMPHPSPWLSPQEAAEYLGIALGTLRNWTSARFVPFAKRGGVVRYHREALDTWMAGGGWPGQDTRVEKDAHVCQQAG